MRGKNQQKIITRKNERKSNTKNIRIDVSANNAQGIGNQNPEKGNYFWLAIEINRKK